MIYFPLSLLMPASEIETTGTELFLAISAVVWVAVRVFSDVLDSYYNLKERRIKYTFKVTQLRNSLTRSVSVEADTEVTTHDDH